MNGYTLVGGADDDIFKIWTYLAQESGESLADRVEATLYSYFEQIAQTPGAGHRRSDLKKSALFFLRAAPYQYMIVYRRTTPVEIVAVVHGKRHLKKLLRQRASLN